MFKQWLEARRKKAAKEKFERGFDYAAGQLLRGTDIDGLEAQIDGAEIFGDHDEFDDGMSAAIVAWENNLPPEMPVPAEWPAIAA